MPACVIVFTFMGDVHRSFQLKRESGICCRMIARILKRKRSPRWAQTVSTEGFLHFTDVKWRFNAGLCWRNGKPNHPRLGFPGAEREGFEPSIDLRLY